MNPLPLFQSFSFNTDPILLLHCYLSDTWCLISTRLQIPWSWGPQVPFVDNTAKCLNAGTWALTLPATGTVLSSIRKSALLTVPWWLLLLKNLRWRDWLSRDVCMPIFSFFFKSHWVCWRTFTTPAFERQNGKRTKANLGCTVSSRLVWASELHPVSESHW